MERTGKKHLYFRCGKPEYTRKQKNIRAQVVLGALYKTLDSLHFTKRDVAKIQNSLTDYINVRHNKLIEEKLRVNAAIKTKKRRQDELAQTFIDLGKDAPKEAKQMVNEQLEECRNDIATLQTERDAIDAKIFDPDQVREILDELTNQLDSLADKMKSADSWQKDQLVRKLVTNLKINNKNEVSFRWKKPLENVLTRLLRTELGLVPETGLEPARHQAYAPKAYVYTNFTTRAYADYIIKHQKSEVLKLAFLVGILN